MRVLALLHLLESGHKIFHELFLMIWEQQAGVHDERKLLLCQCLIFLFEGMIPLDQVVEDVFILDCLEIAFGVIPIVVALVNG